MDAPYDSTGHVWGERPACVLAGIGHEAAIERSNPQNAQSRGRIGVSLACTVRLAASTNWPVRLIFGGPIGRSQIDMDARCTLFSAIEVTPATRSMVFRGQANPPWVFVRDLRHPGEPAIAGGARRVCWPGGLATVGGGFAARPTIGRCEHATRLDWGSCCPAAYGSDQPARVRPAGGGDRSLGRSDRPGDAGGSAGRPGRHRRRKPRDIGLQGVEHITDTSKGTIKLYSSWPLTGAIGADRRRRGRGRSSWRSRTSATPPAASPSSTRRSTTASPPTTAAGTPAKETENANQVVNDADAMVYMATYNSGAAKISIPITERGRDGDDLLRQHLPRSDQGGRRRHRRGRAGAATTRPASATTCASCPADDIQGVARRQLGATTTIGRAKAYILHDNSLYGQGVAQVFRLAFEELGGEVLGFEGYEPNSAGLPGADDQDRRHGSGHPLRRRDGREQRRPRCCRTCAP